MSAEKKLQGRKPYTSANNERVMVHPFPLPAPASQCRSSTVTTTSGARGGSRTRTPNGYRFLRPTRLPFRHPGTFTPKAAERRQLECGEPV